MAEQSTPKIIRPQAGFQEKFVRSNVDVAIGGGVLNPQPIDSLVATPNGFVRIGELKAGDVICDPNGGTQIVNFIIDKGILPCVEFTLSDGRKVRSAMSHNWLVKNHYGKYKRISSEEIVKYIDKCGNGCRKKVNRLRIPLTKCVEMNGCDKLPLHPYLVGYLLGNGCVSSKVHSIYISTSDEDVVDYITSLGYSLRKSYSEGLSAHYEFIGAGFKDLVVRSGIYGMVSSTKSIPDIYMKSSIDDRLQLLKGLFDSDGCACSDEKYGNVSYVTVSKKLCEDVISLIHSLGGTATCYVREGYEREIKGKKCSCRESYTIRARMWNDKDFFNLRRKREKAIDNREGRNAVMLGIKDYELVGEKACVCINVSGDEHLYLTDNYVVTCNCGKTFAAVLSIAEAVDDPNFRGVFLRNNLNDLKSGGGILDTFRDIYGKSVTIVESGDPSATFASGAKCDITHVADQSRDKVLQRFKGRQYDYIYFDEGTGFTWETFVTICSRNRGRAKWTGKIRMTTNPDRNHWLRTFLDWYIGIDGFIREDREGVVRYFYMSGETVKDVVWGDTKEECYHKCKIDIDRKLRKINGKTGNATYKDMIKSFTFYLGRMSENKASLGNNGGYVGTVAMSGGRNAEQLLEGNWNVSPDEDLNAVIPSDIANKVFVVDPQINNDRWITADLADSGTDNFLCLYWNGFHVEDILILGRTTPRENAERLLAFADKHDVPNSHIIYDGIRGLYINDYIPEAIPYISNMKPMGMYGRMALRLKDECYLRLVEMMKRGEMSFADDVANKTYEHALLKERITVQNEFLEECAVVRFKDAQSGKKTLLSKKEMNQMLGRGRSMDLLDPCAMRMYPVLSLPYGDELVGTMQDFDDDDDDSNNNIYDETLWC